jgi:D-alanine-D-alanine ligase
VALRVLHLVGSADSELLAELSRLYARDCLATVADPDRYDPVIAHVTPDRRWSFPATLGDEAIARASQRSLNISQAIAHITSLAIDVAVPQMFCLSGMTEYRALLDLLRIPYLGNRPAVMALGADKARAKAVVAAAGVAVPAGELVVPGQTPMLAPPAIVKPVDGDNSLGLTLVTDPRDYPEAVDDACAHGSAALDERYVELGREVRCGVLDLDGELLCLPLEEYAVSRDATLIRGAADKLARDRNGMLTLVAKERTHAWLLDAEDPVCGPVWEAAQRCHRALGCRQYSLFDFRIDPDGRPWFLEAGLYCSFAHQSVVATMARGAGIDTAELFSSVIREALPVALTQGSAP